VEANFVSWDYNCDFKGQNLAITPNPIPNINQQDCATQCYNNPSCDHFTWFVGDNNNKNLCYLKKGGWPRNAPTPSANARCGFIPVQEWKKGTDANILWADNCDFPGQVLEDGVSWQTDVQDCGVACFLNPECDHFAWSNSEEFCYEKKGQWPGNRRTPVVNVQCGYITRK
jgi:hypothetical protein